MYIGTVAGQTGRADQIDNWKKARCHGKPVTDIHLYIRIWSRVDKGLIHGASKDFQETMIVRGPVDKSESDKIIRSREQSA